MKLRLMPLSALALMLPACMVDSPALGYSRAAFSTVELGGNSYRVYTEETRNCVEVHRVNFVFPPPSRLEILMQMEAAAKQVTQCNVKKGTFIGDQAMSKGQLDCSEGPGAKDWVPGTCNTMPWR
ncbi:hypothetical protein [Celeribacter sp. PS-C1]|uniref:hypothetical protein n=1 Tax=Celeribacter sp. PS-C1 TaxID=2820813 RepID=UPI001CA50027|nr:hypothetical protein [Celeribacter sp. PS-C1]MBW6416530.1 hypothetical protein [Celeribacter sp. PS-C1]